MALHTETVDLTAIVRTAVGRLDEVIARSGSQVCIQVADEPVLGCWDTSALEQVVTNLLTNAIKFGERRPITITVDRLGDTARVIVADRGIGIPEDRLPHIFERFERAVSAREYGGLGLGLFIVHGIVEAFGGSIRVESRSGEGSTFTVELPCTGPNQDAPP
jgi:signal transduction histidine kinase